MDNMKVYRVFVIYAIISEEESWTQETYYIGSESLELARKKLDLVKEEKYANYIDIEECVIENGEIKPKYIVNEIWKCPTGLWYTNL